MGCGPKGPCTQIVCYILWAQCTYIGSTSRPKYILFGHVDPSGLFLLKARLFLCGSDLQDLWGVPQALGSKAKVFVFWTRPLRQNERTVETLYTQSPLYSPQKSSAAKRQIGPKWEFPKIGDTLNSGILILRTPN